MDECMMVTCQRTTMAVLKLNIMTILVVQINRVIYRAFIVGHLPCIYRAFIIVQTNSSIGKYGLSETHTHLHGLSMNYLLNKKTWLVINDTISRNKNKCDLPDTFNYNGLVLSDPIEIANSFNVYFASIGDKLASEIKTPTNKNINFTSYLKNPTKNRLKFTHITEEDTIKAIDNLENKNSSAHDGISNKLLKFIGHVLCKSLTLIINQMLTSGIFPDAFKTAKIIPIHKKGDSALLSNYRPISLLPTISKIFERIIYNQLYQYFNDNGLLAEQQYGFRSQHSTEYAATKLIDHISQEMDSGKTPGALYIDLS